MTPPKDVAGAVERLAKINAGWTVDEAEKAQAVALMRSADVLRLLASHAALTERCSRMAAVRDALLRAGGASPSDGMTRFSFWSLDKLAVAFDLAAATVNPGEPAGGGA